VNLTKGAYNLILLAKGTFFEPISFLLVIPDVNERDPTDADAFRP
jgi:hypothetical protein